MTEVAEQPTVETSQEIISQPEAQVTSNTEQPIPVVEAPKVEVPKKFLKEDGSPDLERFVKSYTELEKKLHNPDEAKNRKKMGDILPSVAQPINTPSQDISADDLFTDPEGAIRAVVSKAVAPYEAKLKYNEMAKAAEKARALPKFTEYEGDIVEEIQKSPALNALFRLGDTSVFALAHGQVLSRKFQDIENSAFDRGRNEKNIIQSSVPKVEGVSSSTPPQPKQVTAKERLAQLIKEGRKMDEILMDDTLLSPAERKLFKEK